MARSPVSVGALALVMAAACGSRTGLSTPLAQAGPSDAAPVADASVEATPLAVGPRLRAPMSTSHVTSQSPTLRWVPGTPGDGVVVQICRDRACTLIEQTFTALDDHAQPRALGPGAHFWRVQERGQTSAVWELFVGAHSAPADAAWGSVLDVNGDGLADLAPDAVDADGSAGRLYVYQGSPGGVQTAPSTSVPGPDGPGGVFAFVANAGDLDGDGFADVAVGATGLGQPATVGKVYVFRGGQSGLDTRPWAVLETPDGAGSRFGTAVAGVGDVDGDGYGDLVVGAYDDGLSDAGVPGDVGFGAAYFYRGGPGGPTLGATLVPARTQGSPGAFGSAVAAAGDVDADGFADFIVSAPQLGSGGEAFVFRGAPSGPSSQPWTELTTATTGEDPRVIDSSFGNVVACAGDVNGDGYSDVLVTVGWTNDERTPGVDVASNNGRVYVYLGSPSGVSVHPAIEYEGPGPYAFGSQAASAGDVNGDGYSDLVLGAFGDGHTADVTGNAFVYLGGAQGLSATPATQMNGPDAAGFFGVVSTSPGDVNGDGFDDVAVAAYEALGATGRVYVFEGSAAGVSATPAATLTGPDAEGNLGATLAIGTALREVSSTSLSRRAPPARVRRTSSGQRAPGPRRSRSDP